MKDSPMKEKKKTALAGEFRQKEEKKMKIWFENGGNQNMKEENV